MLTSAGDRLWAAFVLWLGIMGVLEFARLRGARRLPWWVIHGPVLAWGAVALLPWFIALRSGFWQVQSQPSATVPLSLPSTYGATLMALIGLAVGVAPFAVFGRRAVQDEAAPARVRVAPGKAITVIVILLAVYIASLPSLSNFWSLAAPAGEDLYSDTNGSFLSLSLVVLAAVALGYLASQQALSWAGIALYLGLLVVTLGSAHRYLVMILVLSYLILRRPRRRVGASSIQWLVLLSLGAAAVWLIGFSGLGQLSVLRSGVPASSPSVYTQKTLSSFDVMSSAEYLFETGTQPGQLHMASYLALPAESVPRFLLGSRSTPPAVEAEQGTFGMKTGASAPLWIEGLLNQGAAGDLLSMVVFAGLWGLLLRQALSSPSRIGRTVASLGPVWILFAYQALSRVLMIAAIHLFASVVLGLLLWNWMQAGEGSLEGSVPGDVTVARLPQRGAV
jgi:hypothetical protein